MSEPEKSAPGRSNTWDPDDFAENAHFEQQQQQKNVTRLQDLSLNNSSDDDGGGNHKKKGKEETWPYEEPCAWRGGKNTRNTAEAKEINERLFDPDFDQHAGSFDNDDGDFAKSKSSKNSNHIVVRVNHSAGDSTDGSADDEDSDGEDDDDDSEDDSQAGGQEEEEETETEADTFCGEGASESETIPEETSEELETSDSEAMDYEREGKPAAKSNRVEEAKNRMDSSGGSRSRGSSRDVTAGVESSGMGSSSHHQGSSRRHSAGGDYKQMLNWNKQDDEDEEMLLEQQAQQQSQSRGGGGSRRSEFSNADQGVQQPQAAAQQNTRRARRSAADADLSKSCHGQIENQPIRRRGGRRSHDELSATSSHGPARSSSTGAAGPHSSSTSGAHHASSRRPGPPRTKSSDGMELIGSQTTHGTGHGPGSGAQSSSRSARAKRRSERRAAKPGDRRGMLKRAMSTQNVKRPEEYNPNNKGMPSSSRSGQERRRSGRRPLNRSSSHSDDEGMRSSRRGSDSYDKSQSSTGSGSPRRGMRRTYSNDSSAGSTAGAPRRRDLLVLLREQKAVHAEDLLDKENRRLLHFLMYEHKMGLSVKEIQKKIRKRAEEDDPDIKVGRSLVMQAELLE